jgi:hypothetical protein
MLANRTQRRIIIFSISFYGSPEPTFSHIATSMVQWGLRSDGCSSRQQLSPIALMPMLKHFSDPSRINFYRSALDTTTTNGYRNDHRSHKLCVHIRRGDFALQTIDLTTGTSDIHLALQRVVNSLTTTTAVRWSFLLVYIIKLKWYDYENMHVSLLKQTKVIQLV